MHWNLPSVNDEEREWAEELWTRFGFVGEDLTPLLRLLRHLRSDWRADMEARLTVALQEALQPIIPCADCEVDVFEIDERFMVNDQVWAAAGLEPDSGWMCVECLEARLGRELVADDFADLPMNAPDYPHSPRLADRIAAR